MKNIKTNFLNFLIFLGTLLLIVSSLMLAYTVAYNGRIYPNITVNNVSISGNSEDKAITELSSKTIPITEFTLIYQDQAFKIKSEDINLSYDINKSINDAYGLVRTGNFPVDLVNKASLLFKPVNLPLIYSIDENKLTKIVSIIAGQVSTDSVNPSVSLTGNAVYVNRGLPGKEVDQDKLIEDIKKNISTNSSLQIQIPVNSINNSINETEANNYYTRATKLVGKKIILKFEYTTLTLNDSEILKLIAPYGEFYDENVSNVAKNVSTSIERDPQNPKFVFENGKVSEFQPALDGIKLDTDQFKVDLTNTIINLESGNQKELNVDIPVIKTLPEVSTEKVNNLGIKELIGRGTSTFFHSIPGRVHNVALAASRINGTLIKPGETFSFNSTLGDVSAFTGYQQAYIISEGKTILGDGGGVCQVSSTLFRAVLDAGLPINERTAHAYRVGYYEQGSSPGFDATVYSPSPDFKFTNDTDNYILIEANTDTKNYSLVFELYGTKDGRTVSISKPVVTNVTAPPPDVYQDDPSLPIGTIKQIDYKAWGAKVSFHYIVTRGGQELINKTFISNYKPWAAVYLRGTGTGN